MATNKQKKSNKRAPKQLSLGPLGIPDSWRATLTYSDIIHITPGASIGQYTFRGNSVFDPDYTSTGHQPYYRDQLQAPYSRYRVYGSSIRLSAVNEQVASALQVTVIPSSEITAFTSSTYPIEYPHARPMPMLGVGAILPKTVSHKISTSRVLGLRPREVLDQDYSALSGAQPSSEWYWLIVAQDLTSAQNVETSLQVIITYDVEFYDRTTVSPSVSKPLTPEQISALAFGPKPAPPTQSPVTPVGPAGRWPVRS